MPYAAVLGTPIAHSLSPVLHNAGYEALGLEGWNYGRHEVDEAALPAFVEQASADTRGFSVTMPGKFAALQYADEVTERAQLIGSANTLVRIDGGQGGWRADNTDTEGVVGALDELLSKGASVERALLVGSGGTARPALWALAQRGVKKVHVVNRSPRIDELAPLAQALGITLEDHRFGEELAQLSTESDVVVSTVPSAAVAPWLDVLAHAPVMDVIYDRLPTPLMVAAAANGYATVGGHVMLAHQAFSQFEQFTGQPAPREHMVRALEQALQSR